MKNLINCIKIGLTALLVLLGLTAAQALPIYNFVAPFAPSDWTLQPDQGQVFFANNNTELDLVGPTGNFYPSYDAISIVAPPVAGGPWQLSFNYTFSAGDSQGTTALISWAGEPDGNPVVLASGGPGSSSSGYFDFTLDPGDMLSILLDSGETGAGKQPSSLVITDFSIPDSTPWIEAALFLPLLCYRFLPSVRRQS
jgi:hypothetical protein